MPPEAAASGVSSVVVPVTWSVVAVALRKVEFVAVIVLAVRWSTAENAVWIAEEMSELTSLTEMPLEELPPPPLIAAATS